MRLSIGNSKAVLVVGTRGDGKTELTSRIFAGWIGASGGKKAGVVVDPKGAGALKRRWPTLSPARAIKQLQPGQVVRVRPDVTWPSIDAVFNAIWARGKNTCTLVDETVLIGNQSKWPVGLQRIIQLGREAGMGIICLAQDVVRIPPFVKSQADVIVIFHVTQPAYVVELAGHCGMPPSELEAMIGRLGRHDFLVHVKGEGTTWCPAIDL